MPATTSTSNNVRSAPLKSCEKYNAAPTHRAKRILVSEIALGDTRHFTSSWANRLAHAACRVFKGLLADSVSIIRRENTLVITSGRRGQSIFSVTLVSSAGANSSE